MCIKPKKIEKWSRKFEKNANFSENFLIFGRDYGKNMEYNMGRL